MTQRVVVTGMGTVTPLGNDVTTTMKNITAGQVGFVPITKFAAAATGITLAGELKDFDVTMRLDKRLSKRLDLFSQYALYSALEAAEQADLTAETVAPERLGVMIGSGIGGLTTIEAQVTKMNAKGPQRVSPLFVPESIANMAAGNVALQFNARNICTAVVTACSSGTNAIGDAFREVQSGRADMMIAGGAEAPINQIGIAGFAALSALSPATDPQRASIPFDQDRAGFVMGEGAGMLILESLAHAQQRGATIYGEITGYGSTCDAFHMTAPDPAGTQAARAMQLAIDESGATAADFGYVNAHGTSTKANDAAESAAINQIFATPVLVSSTKSMTGHLLGAAGAIEAVITLAALRQKQLPVNVGVQQQDPACPVTLVTAENRQQEVTNALSNSFGFGGHNAVLALRKWA
ncbi:beta-ketoacyl-ACP synthase II [Loigolactobacillus zhaoyuanensis]|uniref:3-oxoacyl-[acyl-carrier-protein] synthase 2 n=1 Tax=Loigolactobacillus zhaoyuanensis TaxID=2486017 RepID=A0ABW8UFI5_9LACO